MPWHCRMLCRWKRGRHEPRMCVIKRWQTRVPFKAGLEEYTHRSIDLSLCLSDNYASLSISNNHAFAHTPAADVDSVFPKLTPRFPLMMYTCMIHAGNFTAERRGNKPEHIFCVWAGASALTLPWDWMAAFNVSDKPGAAATNQSPPNPGENNESGPAGIQRCVSALRCVCWAGWGNEGGENALEIRDLLITLCSISLHLLPLSSSGLLFFGSMFMLGVAATELPSVTASQSPAFSTHILAELYQVYQQHYDEKRAWRQLNAAPCGPLPTPSFTAFSPAAAVWAALIGTIKTDSVVWTLLLCAGFITMRFEYEWTRAPEVAAVDRGGGGGVKR